MSPCGSSGDLLEASRIQNLEKSIPWSDFVDVFTSLGRFLVPFGHPLDFEGGRKSHPQIYETSMLNLCSKKRCEQNRKSSRMRSHRDAKSLQNPSPNLWRNECKKDHKKEIQKEGRRLRRPPYSYLLISTYLITLQPKRPPSTAEPFKTARGPA